MLQRPSEVAASGRREGCLESKAMYSLSKIRTTMVAGSY